MSSRLTIERRGKCEIRYYGLALPKLPEELTFYAIEALFRTVQFWRRNVGPKHFMQVAYGIYGKLEPYVYIGKSGAPKWMMDYYHLPAASADKNQPMVSSGNLRTAFLQGNMTLKSGVEEGGVTARATWPNLPRYTYYFNPAAPSNIRSTNRHSMHPMVHDKARMLTIINADEAAKLVKVFGDEFAKQLAERDKDVAEAVDASSASWDDGQNFAA